MGVAYAVNRCGLCTSWSYRIALHLCRLAEELSASTAGMASGAGRKGRRQEDSSSESLSSDEEEEEEEDEEVCCVGEGGIGWENVKANGFCLQPKPVNKTVFGGETKFPNF